MTGKTRNTDETPVHFNMPTNVTVNTKGATSVFVKTMENSKNRITVILGNLTDGTKLSPYIVLKRKNLPKEKLWVYVWIFGSILRKCRVDIFRTIQPIINTPVCMFSQKYTRLSISTKTNA